MPNLITRGLGMFGAISVGGEQSSKIGGSVKCSVVAGVNETVTPSITVTGMVAGDRIVAVLVFTTAASIATLAAKALADISAGAGVISVNANAANNSANQYVVIWEDRT
jgi:hypothetical protein